VLSTVLDVVASGGEAPSKIVWVAAAGDPSAAVATARFPNARVVLVDGSPVPLQTLNWWDVMFGADAVVAWKCLHHLNDAKKQYLYKAAAERLSSRGAMVIGDRIESQQLLHHLIWLKHAGFSIVDCFWVRDRHAVFGGFKQAGASAPRLPADS
jgi:hypothetical protein